MFPLDVGEDRLVKTCKEMNIMCGARMVLPLCLMYVAMHKFYYTVIVTFNHDTFVFIHPQLDDVGKGSHHFLLNGSVILICSLHPQG